MRLSLTNFVFVCVAFAASQVLAAGELSLTVVDAETQTPIPCRLHLRNEKDRAQRAAKMPFWNDHFVIPGTVTLKLAKGTYHFEIERGPEYVVRNGYLIIGNQSKDNKVVDLPRACNMAEEGWWAGDLHVHRPVNDAELLMRAEDLHVAGLSTWSTKKNEWTGRTLPTQPVKQFDKNRYCDLLGGESADKGSTFLYLNVDRPLLTRSSGDGQAPSSLAMAREHENAWIDAVRPTAWDLPVWLATGRVDSIELANDQFCRGEMIDDANGRPRDKKLMPGPVGIGRWTHEIYYHVLNCGLRVPPSAGSGSGEAPNPVGYNRVYVWVDKDHFNYETWWKGFRMGRSVVTNGPLIRPFANGQLPGHVFTEPEGETFVLDVLLNFTARDTISYFELIKDGRLAQTVRYEEVAKSGRLPPVKFESSGWLLIRAVTDVENTYRFATSAPWYVEMGDEPHRVSRASAQFFLDWLNERKEMIDKQKTDSPLAASDWAAAREFWEKRLAEANAD
ncbi:MAG TPA: hypothetical protein VHC22_06810 [Pirellulales bacterium]|nr:hypothetical protein [Pirellulales bacterium]